MGAAESSGIRPRLCGKEKVKVLSHFIQNIYDVVVLVVLFGVTIFVHEFGHFIMALKLGFVVETFSIGFGPALWKRKIRGINFKIGWIPFGGYVSLPQLDPSGMSTIQGGNGEPDESSDDGPAYPEVAGWKKIIVSVSGAAGNVLFAVLLAWIIFLSPGADVGASSATVGYVATNSPAFARGLRPGDTVVAVNDRPVGTWYRFSEECLLGADESGEVDVAVEHKGERRNLRLELADEIKGQVIEGIDKARPCLIGKPPGGSNAVAAGLKEGDIVEKLDGISVASDQHLERLMRGREGEKAALTVRRDGELIEQETVLPVENVEPAGDCLIGFVVEGSPAESAGLKPGDIVRKFGGADVVNWMHFRRLVGASEGSGTSMVVERKGETVSLSIKPEYSEEYERMMVGAAEGAVPVLPWMRYKQPSAQLKGDTRGIIRILKALTTPGEAGNAVKALGGPVMIVRALWASIKLSILNAVGFLRFLNINLAILNLLPIPVLDGGHIVIALWETVTRRKVNARFINIVTNAFAVLLIGLMILITFRDIERLFPGIRKMFGRENASGQEIENTSKSALGVSTNR